ncbi:MAG: hypothetical protein AAF502_19570 [Bacteroidota bacterium]
MNIMKFGLTTFLLLGVLSISFACGGYSISDSRLIVKVNAGDIHPSVEIRLANLEKEVTKVKIKKSNGRTYFIEKIKQKAGYCKLIKLNNFPAGEYQVIIERPNSETITDFIIYENQIEFEETFTNRKALLEDGSASVSLK